MIHGLDLPIQAQDLIKANQTSKRFRDVYHYITDEKLPSGAKAQARIQAEALNYVVINISLFRIDTHKDKDQDKENSFLLVIPEQYEPIIIYMYHDPLLAGHQGPYRLPAPIPDHFRKYSIFSISGANVKSNLDTHLSDTPFAIWQPIQRPCLLERVYKPIHTPHWCEDLWSFTTENTRDRV